MRGGKPDHVGLPAHRLELRKIEQAFAGTTVSVGNLPFYRVMDFIFVLNIGISLLGFRNPDWLDCLVDLVGGGEGGGGV